VSWWDPGNSATRPVLLDAALGTFFLENAAVLTPSHLPSNATYPGQVAKGFWDLVDVNNESGTVDCNGDSIVDNDDHTLGLTVLQSVWDSLPDGVADGMDREALAGGGADVNAVNAWDWVQNYGLLPPVSTLMHHNCLTAQDPN
jgi:hypothetical protein